MRILPYLGVPELPFRYEETVQNQAHLQFGRIRAIRLLTKGYCASKGTIKLPPYFKQTAGQNIKHILLLPASAPLLLPAIACALPFLPPFAVDR